MDIYKLSDNIPTGHDLTKKHKRDTMEVEASKDVGDSVVITDLKQGVRNPDRVNVYVNEKYSFSLDISQVVDLGVKVGRVISPEELEEFKKASEFGKLYQRSLEWILTRPRSEKELRDYLYKKVYERKLDKSLINLVVDRLREKRYLDDRKFAEHYVENRFVKKGISKKRLSMELLKKGVSKEIIEEILNKTDRSDADEIKKIIIKKRNKYDDKKLTQYLCRQGFQYDLVQELVRSCGKD